MSRSSEPIDPEDLNVETPADYDRFAKLAEQRELEFLEDYTLARECCMVQEGLTDWEMDFVDSLYRKLKEQQVTDHRIGLSPAQRNRMNKILERLGK